MAAKTGEVSISPRWRGENVNNAHSFQLQNAKKVCTLHLAFYRWPFS